MRLRDRVALWALLTVGLCGCATTKQIKAEEHEQLKVDETDKATKHEAETTTTAPTDSSSSSQVEDLGVIAQAADGSITVARVDSAHPLKLAAGSKVMGTVPLREVEQKSATHQGGSTDTKTTDSCEDVGLNLEKRTDKKAEEHDKTSYWPPWWVFAGGAALLAAAGALAWKLKPPWLTAAIGLAKRL